MSSLCEPNNRAVGASTSGFGILTGLLAMIFVNWKAFDGNNQLEQTRCILIFFVVFLIMINFMFSVGVTKGIDNWGHLGGAMTGLFWGMAVLPRVKSEGGTKMRIVGLVLTGGYLTLMILLFFLVSKPLMDPFDP